MNMGVAVAIFFFPWWIVGISIAILSLYFSKYYEIIGAGFLIDLVYGAPVAYFFGFPYTVTLIATVFFIVVQYIKSRLRHYDTI